MANSEGRPNKIAKKQNARKQSKALEIFETEESSPSDDTRSPDTKSQLKRAQGIVIDGKTYTCTTCKAGHRVGICKHAHERPMKPTHPPGRPPAGAPKKIVCDCPKTCSCTKRSCKCARICHCTQPMYMLVYIPAPEENDDDDDEEKGEWKVREKVTTDLKGNVLTPEEVKERQEKKEAMKLLPKQPRTQPTLEDATDSDHDEPKKSCCKHKNTIATRNIAAQASMQSGIVPRVAADGCNCGHTCTCAFCPQHPNNSTSTNVARQQAVFFANQSIMNDQRIVPFVPTLPQEVSCMGGQPRFAISRDAERPSFDDLQKTFPNPGYVIGYPIWTTRTDNSGFPMAPFPMSNDHVFDNTMGMPAMSTTSLDNVSTYQGPSMIPHDYIANPEMSQDEFGIGNAFVASAGAGSWNNNLISPNNLWTHLSNMPVSYDDMSGTHQFILGNQPSLNAQVLSQIPPTPHFECHNSHIQQPPLPPQDENVHYNAAISAQLGTAPFTRSQRHHSSATETVTSDGDMFEQYLSPIFGSPSSTNRRFRSDNST